MIDPNPLVTVPVPFHQVAVGAAGEQVHSDSRRAHGSESSPTEHDDSGGQIPPMIDGNPTAAAPVAFIKMAVGADREKIDADGAAADRLTVSPDHHHRGALNCDPLIEGRPTGPVPVSLSKAPVAAPEKDVGAYISPACMAVIAPNQRVDDTLGHWGGGISHPVERPHPVDIIEGEASPTSSIIGVHDRRVVPGVHQPQ